MYALGATNVPYRPSGGRKGPSQWGPGAKWVFNYFKKSYAAIPSRKRYYKSQLAKLTKNPGKVYNALRTANALYSGRYLAAAYHARNYFQEPYRTNYTRYKRYRRIRPSNRYRYRQAYRSKRLPYWIWLRNKRNRKKRYRRRYTTWNY